MGFLSRKIKSAPLPTDDPHPIVEELRAMEAAVPAHRDDKGSDGQPAGPVTAGDPPPPAVAEASSGAVPPAPPPAEEAPEADDTTSEQDETSDSADDDSKEEE